MTTTNNKPQKILITTAIDYANSVIHVGHAYEKILADCMARYYRKLIGPENVFFVTGTDEHGTSTYKAAQKAGEPVEEYTKKVSQEDKEQIDSLDISYDRFICTTNEDHKKVASEFFEKALKTGAIYKGKYEGLYCEGCEAYKTLTELDENGKCPFHVSREIQKVEEENYFLKWSDFAEDLKKLIEQKDFILPETRKNEMLGFLTQGLQDLPVSRPKYKVPWGIPVPGDEEQVIYVWYDALVNYYTAAKPKGFWEDDVKIVHFVGKDILRWHSLLWPAMLMNLGLRLPNTIYTHGFVNLDGQKISKSLGNVIYPKDLVEKYGVDAVRYYFLKHGPITEDVDISLAHFEEVYNADLANGLGNTVARIAKMAQNSGIRFKVEDSANIGDSGNIWDSTWATPLTEFRADLALQNIRNMLSQLDKHINENEPWGQKDSKKLEEILSFEVNSVRYIAQVLEPFLPSTSKKIQEQYQMKGITTTNALFPRL
ncbi:MAG TPA: methionine--tRNA ligase [candidate division WWE3 bacterium]|uniref:Methionine--tRNA ligase n=1 Tax=candidate division WWE3 bacterium TaxID=2053526 RepID=A0A7C1DJ11_UNCKA|nr:methionine--tRNA ligase [candidate division WWE3 bacterium]